MTRGWFLAGCLLLAAGAGIAANQMRDRFHAASGPPAQSARHSAVSRQSPPALTSTFGTKRLPVSAAQSRAELSSGGILRPVRSILNQSGPMQYGSWQWDEQGVADGPLWVRADLAGQILSVFRGGHEIGTAVMVYGTDGLATPTGRFPIKAKIRDHRSSLYGSPMPFTLRLTDDGVSIHGSNVRSGAATHGCIGIPPAFARRLFDTVSAGDQVLIVDTRAAG